MNPAASQTTFATLTGTVTGSTGAAVPNVTVTATHAATNTQTATQSNEEGVYTLAQLKEGTYTVRARAAGFKEFIAQSIVLEARDYRRVEIHLEGGTVETAVEVTEGATLIETESARISDTKGAELLKSIPLNTHGRRRNVTIRPDHLRNANLPGGQRSVGRWFDASAFGPLTAGLGRFGTSAKGVIKGPGVNVWHVGFYKTFPLRDRMLLRWETTADELLQSSQLFESRYQHLAIGQRWSH